MPIKGNILYPFKWFFRPASAPVVQLIESIDVEASQIPGLLQEINPRQWAAVEQVLMEAKFKAEAQLRDDRLMGNHGALAYYQGWVNYADYILASLEGLRSGQVPPASAAPTQELP